MTDCVPVTWVAALGVVAVGLAAGGYALHKVLLSAGRRGWIYYRNNPRPPGGGSLGLFEEIYQPSMEHVTEERSSARMRGSQDESGEPPFDSASEKGMIS